MPTITPLRRQIESKAYSTKSLLLPDNPPSLEGLTTLTKKKKGRKHTTYLLAPAALVVVRICQLKVFVDPGASSGGYRGILWHENFESMGIDTLDCEKASLSITIDGTVESSNTIVHGVGVEH